MALAREVARRSPATDIVVVSAAAAPEPGDLSPQAVFPDKPFTVHQLDEAV